MESATDLQNAKQKLALLPNTSRHRRQMLSPLAVSVAFLHHSTLAISHKLRSTVAQDLSHGLDSLSVRLPCQLIRCHQHENSVTWYFTRADHCLCPVPDSHPRATMWSPCKSPTTGSTFFGGVSSSAIRLIFSSSGLVSNVVPVERPTTLLRALRKFLAKGSPSNEHGSPRLSVSSSGNGALGEAVRLRGSNVKVDR